MMLNCDCKCVCIFISGLIQTPKWHTQFITGLACYWSLFCQSQEWLLPINCHGNKEQTSWCVISKVTYSMIIKTWRMLIGVLPIGYQSFYHAWQKWPVIGFKMITARCYEPFSVAIKWLSIIVYPAHACTVISIIFKEKGSLEVWWF